METANSISDLNEIKEKSDMALVYFGSDTCGVCRDILPKLEKMIRTYSGVKAVKVEAKSLPELFAEYSVFAYPVIILFIQGKETIREAGVISLINLEQKIARYYTLFYDRSEG
jgi:thioredoxin-like negative regulator of GroEL